MLKSIVKKYKFEILFLTLGCIFFVKFCNSFMIELPHLSWFGHFNLLDHFYNGTLRLYDLLSVRSGSCGLLGYNLLFLLNTVCFKMTTFFDVYLNDLMVLLIGIVSVCKLRQVAEKKDYSYLVALVLVCIAAFSAIQLSSGAMETQVRLGILFFVFASVYVDKVLLDNYAKKDLVFAIILIFLSLNVFGTAYSFAGIPVVLLICFIAFLKNKKIDKARLFIVLSYILAAVTYFFQYFIVVKGPWRLKEGTIFDAAMNIITHPFAVFRAICGYNASGLLGSAGYLDGKITADNYFALGIFVTAIMVYAIFKFIQLKMYKKTFVPVLFMGYSFFVPFLVMLDREASLEWVINEWYVVNTKLGIIGTIMILFFVFQNSKFVGVNKFLVSASMVCILAFSLFGNVCHVKRAKFVKIYYEAKQPYLFAQSLEELPVDANGMTPLIAPLEDTMKAINLLKKYRLNVYKYYDAFEKYNETVKQS